MGVEKSLLRPCEICNVLLHFVEIPSFHVEAAELGCSSEPRANHFGWEGLVQSSDAIVLIAIPVALSFVPPNAIEEGSFNNSPKLSVVPFQKDDGMVGELLEEKS